MLATAILCHNGKEYRITEQYQVDQHCIKWLWTDGNYSCDCNRSLFIRRHCDGDFPELPCGETIELVGIGFA